MAINNAINLGGVVNADGFTIGGGTTRRTLTFSGADIALVAAADRTYNLPGASGTFLNDSRSVSTTGPLQGGGTLNADLTLTLISADGSSGGYLTSANWTTFNDAAGKAHDQNTDTGTDCTTFHIDSDATGPKLKNSSGELQARNSADNAYADFRCKDLHVEGDQTILNTETVTTEDNIILLNSNQTGVPSEDGGIEIERGATIDAYMLWNETSDRWECGLTGALQSLITTGDTVDAAKLANVLGIDHGGTGATTAPTAFDALVPFTTKGDVIATHNGTGATRLPIGDDDQVLTADAAASYGFVWKAASGGGGGIDWEELTGSTTIAINAGYIMNLGTLLTGTLPATAAVGSVIAITGKGAGGWKVAQQASQQVHFGTMSSTSGTGGYLQSVGVRDSIRMVCIVANNEWNVVSSVGNITIS